MNREPTAIKLLVDLINGKKKYNVDWNQMLIFFVLSLNVTGKMCCKGLFTPSESEKDQRTSGKDQRIYAKHIKISTFAFAFARSQLKELFTRCQSTCVFIIAFNDLYGIQCLLSQTHHVDTCIESYTINLLR